MARTKELHIPRFVEQKTTGPHQFLGNREAWCIKISHYLLQRMAKEDIAHMPDNRSIKVSIAPISRVKTIGICYPSSASESKNVNHIVISPVHASEEELCKTILHELLHAIDDCNSGHKGRWKRLAGIFDMTRTSSFDELNEFGKNYIKGAIKDVGLLVEHERQVLSRPKRLPSLVPLSCPQCHLKAYVSSKLDIKQTLLTCAMDGSALISLA